MLYLTNFALYGMLMSASVRLKFEVCLSCWSWLSLMLCLAASRRHRRRRRRPFQLSLQLLTFKQPKAVARSAAAAPARSSDGSSSVAIENTSLRVRRCSTVCVTQLEIGDCGVPPNALVDLRPALLS